MPIIHYLEVTIRRAYGKLDKFKKFERNLVLYLDTIMRFTQNDLFRRTYTMLSIYHLARAQELYRPQLAFLMVVVLAELGALDGTGDSSP